jgi:hypothetical protein
LFTRFLTAFVNDALGICRRERFVFKHGRICQKFWTWLDSLAMGQCCISSTRKKKPR